MDTFLPVIAAENPYAIRLKMQPLDIAERQGLYSGMWKRFRSGRCSFISPFNSRLIWQRHKICQRLPLVVLS